LPTFLSWSGAIETAFQETQAVAGTMDVQQGEGFVIPTWEYNMLMGPGSALGFNTGASLSCKNMAVQGTLGYRHLEFEYPTRRLSVERGDPQSGLQAARRYGDS
jgi:hypothetical protein